MRKLFGLFIVMFFAFPAMAEPLTEQQKIDALLDALSNSDIIFVHNGETMDSFAARQHLENKLKETKGIETAEDFIVKVASKSSHTGKPYLIREKVGGNETEAEKWFRDRLKELLLEDTTQMID